ncbi:HCL486Wp [Eremothecium sinecaudum]|uniref:dolichol kinase n=1 Tax=Eremothecium sinecaudum TaxID=45286 RepID=A0A120K1R3_9SACH|nr:HCL486Wp [Eremothecium sinecaudum]AMD19665.1 HCL486Wp [Eremothecium sinecaudum]
MGKKVSKRSTSYYAVIRTLLSGERVVQWVILGTTFFLAANKLIKTNDDIALFVTLLGTAVAFGVGNAVWYRPGGSQIIKTLPSFNTVYLLFLPFMLSLLFNRDLVLVNCAMALNISLIPVFIRLPIQFAILLFNYGYHDDALRNLVALFINSFACFMLEHISELKSLDETECNLFSILLTNVIFLIHSDSRPFLILKTCMLAFLAGVLVNYSVLTLCRPIHPMFRTLTLLTMFAIVYTGFILKFLHIDKVNNGNALIWLLRFIWQSKTRMTILSCWIASLFLLFPNVFFFKSKMSLNMSRKIWHFLLLPLVVPSMLIEPEFTSIALAGIMTTFFVVEYFRYMELAPLGTFINSQFYHFADYRDLKGPLIVSYIYLMLGVSFPLLVNQSLVGIISLGVGDSLASIVGKNYGRNRWPGTRKTIEGTVAFVFSTAMFALVAQRYFGAFKGLSDGRIILACVLSGVLEGNSTLNDNLLIPAFMMIIMELFKY